MFNYDSNERTRVILIAEDDATDRFILLQACLREDLEKQVRFVIDGQQTIDYLEGNPPYDNRADFPFPVLLVLDLQMPGINGFDVLAYLRKTPKLCELPVVVLSVSDLAEDQERAIALGALEYHVKSPTMHQTQEFVARICRKWLGPHASA